LKEGLGTHASSFETIDWWVNGIKNGQEETDTPCSGAPTMVTDKRHMKQVKPVRAHSISCTAIATEVRIRKFCAKRIPHVLNDDQRAMHALLATIHLQH
jgi:hypothetical protein